MENKLSCIERKGIMIISAISILISFVVIVQHMSNIDFAALFQTYFYGENTNFMLALLTLPTAGCLIVFVGVVVFGSIAGIPVIAFLTILSIIRTIVKIRKL